MSQPVPSPTRSPARSPASTYDRDWFVQQFRHLLTGWHQVLAPRATAAWSGKRRMAWRTENFISASGKQIDGVTRMMPALAAWAALDENPRTLTLDDGQTLEPRQLLRDIFTQAFDPTHQDAWPTLAEGRRGQAQVESSIVAWSLWLSRDWLLPQLEARHIQQIQRWLAAAASYDVHTNNWVLFVGVNEAARYALRDHGFAGDLEQVRKALLPLDTLRLPGGWMWDRLGQGIDYYNFWVYGSHDLYLAAMLGDETPSMVRRSLADFAHAQARSAVLHGCARAEHSVRPITALPLGLAQWQRNRAVSRHLPAFAGAGAAHARAQHGMLVEPWQPQRAWRAARAFDAGGQRWRPIELHQLRASVLGDAGDFVFGPAT